MGSKLAVFVCSGKGAGADTRKVQRPELQVFAWPRSTALDFELGTLDAGVDASLPVIRVRISRRRRHGLTSKMTVTKLQIWAGACLIVMLAAGYSGAEDVGSLSEFRDDKFRYRFLYPTDWKLEALPEGEADQTVRLRLRGIAGSSFLVIIENTRQLLSKREFRADPKADQRVETMMRETLEHTYRSISKNMGALAMQFGEKRNLSDESAVKYYLATLHAMKSGSPVIVAGLHAYPFSKDYSVNFIMTAFHRGNAAENQILIEVFNSFRLLDEIPTLPKAP